MKPLCNQTFSLKCILSLNTNISDHYPVIITVQCKHKERFEHQSTVMATKLNCQKLDKDKYKTLVKESIQTKWSSEVLDRKSLDSKSLGTLTVELCDALVQAASKCVKPKKG